MIDQCIPRQIRFIMKRIPGVLLMWQFFRFTIPSKIDRALHATQIMFLESLPLFAPNSPGPRDARLILTFEAANRTFPLLAQLAETSRHRKQTIPLKDDSISAAPSAQDAANELEKLFGKHYSDKSSYHNYHRLYGPILRLPESITKVLEIGIGTNNEDVVSNMGRKGSPGASLRAFRDFLPHAQIYGADIDPRILFREERIDTFVVDQTDLTSLARLGDSVGTDFDLIIDDGLHAPHANLAVLLFAMNRVRPGGFIVIEDIARCTAPLWEVAMALVPSTFECQLFDTRNTLVLVAQRLT